LEGGERNSEFEYPDEHWMYYTMAERFGWLPEQVDNLPAHTAAWLIAIGDMVEQVKAERVKE
jgi:hypothetical protein